MAFEMLFVVAHHREDIAMKYVKLAALTRALTTPVRTRPSHASRGADEAPPSTRRVPPPSTRSPSSVAPKTVREGRV